MEEKNKIPIYVTTSDAETEQKNTSTPALFCSENVRTLVPHYIHSLHAGPAKTNDFRCANHIPKKKSEKPATYTSFQSATILAHANHLPRFQRDDPFLACS